jgi:predicted RNA binding protein YcfA (HicA-like mRNA interferase family)
MKYPAHIWDQLKNITADDLIAALVKDGWVCDTKGGSEHIYYHAQTRRRVSVHYHPKKTYGPKMLKGLLTDTGWTENDFKRLKLVKR